MRKLIKYIAPLVVLATSPFIGYSNPSRVTNPDITVPVARQYESITSSMTSVASGPIGSFTGHYSKKSGKTLILHDEKKKALLTIRQKANSSVSKAKFRNSAYPIVGTLRLGLLNEEIEVARFYNSDGTYNSISKTTEHIEKFKGEESAKGTTIETFFSGDRDHIIQSDYAPVGMSRPGLGGSKVKVNGKPVYEIKPLFGPKGLFKGFDLVANNGETFARLRATRELKGYKKALDFFCEGDKIGSVYLDRRIKSHGESGPTDNRDVLDVDLSGDNPREKLANLENMDLTMALMPDQVKMNAHGLQKAERFVDALRFIYFARNAKKPDYVIRDAALDFVTEEDPTTTLEAIALMVPNSGLDIEQILKERPRVK